MNAEKTTISDTLLIPCSHLSTESNKTGSWRFLRPRYDEKTAPCSAACPAGEDIGRVEMLTAQGQFKEAWETILAENPFPAACGRVCYHPCETVCNRKEFDEAIAIPTLERFLADIAARYHLEPDLDRLSAKEPRVAVVGAGPSGLAAAYFLSRLGYRCDVFEAMPEPGGVLRWGVPEYRLPRAVLQAEVEQIEKTGCTLHCGHKISRSFQKKARDRYDAIFMGCGHARIPRLGIPGESLPGVSDGLAFLKEIRLERPPRLDGPVAVIGGGNTAIDVARSVQRLGGQAILIYRRRRQDMPAFGNELEMALEEGIELRELRSPVHIEAGADQYRLQLQHMQVVAQDQDGRARVEPLPAGTETLTVTRVFTAIGLQAAEEWYNPPPAGAAALRLHNTVLSHLEEEPVVVYGGDLAARLKSVVHAVASGKEAAMALDVLFSDGPAAIESRLEACRVGGGPSLSMEMYLAGPRCRRNPHIVDYAEINADYFQLRRRIVPPHLLKEERIQSFAEIDLKISADLAIREAKRCFHCGLCNQCDNCRLFCPDLAVIRETTGEARHIDYDYCKGCGICVVECPRNAMVLEQEA